MTTTHETLTVEDRLDRVSAQLTALSDQLDADRAEVRRAIAPVTELAETVTPLGGQAMALATSTLQTLDEKGYAVFGRGGARIVDRIVSTYTEEDVQALGDNVVLILDALRSMTQPEIMQMVRRTALTVQEDADEVGDPPSTFALLRSMRDPQTRRGMAKLLSMLHSLGELPTTTTPSAVPTARPAE